MDELADSAYLVSDADGLRRRLADDGYLFFRSLLSAGQVQAAGQAVQAQLRSGGWIDDRGIPSIEPRAVNSMDALADPALRAAMFGPAFNEIPYRPALREVVRRILGPRAFSYPAKVLRAVYPERPQARPRGRYIHYDWAHPASKGTDDHRPAGPLTPDPRAPRLAALAAATRRHRALAGRSR